VKRDGSIQLNDSNEKPKAFLANNKNSQSLRNKSLVKKSRMSMSSSLDETNKKKDTNDNNSSEKIEEYDPFNPDDSPDENDQPKVTEKIKFEIKSAYVGVAKSALLEDSPMKKDDTTQNENGTIENIKTEKTITIESNENNILESEKSIKTTKITPSSTIVQIKSDIKKIDNNDDLTKVKSDDSLKDISKKDHRNHEKSDKTSNDKAKTNQSRSPHSIKKESKTRSKSKSPSRRANNPDKNTSKSSNRSYRRSRSNSSTRRSSKNRKNSRDRTRERNDRDHKSNQKVNSSSKRSRSRSHKSSRASRSPPTSTKSNPTSSRSHHYRNHDDKDYSRNDRSRDNRHSESDRSRLNKSNNLKRNNSPDNLKKNSQKSLKNNGPTNRSKDQNIKGSDYLIEEMLNEESQQTIDINKISLPTNSEIKIPKRSITNDDKNNDSVKNIESTASSLSNKTNLDKRLDLIFGSSVEKVANGNGLKDKNKHEEIKKENNKNLQKPLTTLEKDLAKFSIVKKELESESKKVSTGEPYDPEREYQENGSRILNEAKLNDQKLKTKNNLPGADTSLSSLNLSGSNGKKKKHKSSEKKTSGTILDSQEKIVDAAKLALKPYFVSKKVNKDDYKNIMKKVVTKSLLQNKLVH